jgi:microcystin-dependent protein
MSIIAPLPYNIANGDPIDATPPMANFNQIVANVNANAADLHAQNTFTQPQNGVAAILGAQLTTLAQVAGLFASLVPTGTILDYAGTAAPAGSAWLLCDGSAVSRTTQAALFTVIGTTWGAGDGVSTFNLPDFRRASSVGSGGSSTGFLGNTVGSAGGAETHGIAIAELPAHNHTVNDPTHVHSVSDPSHVHTINDPGHAHAVSDPGHAHSYTATTAGGGTFATGFPNQAYAPNAAATAGSGTGIGIFGAVTGVYNSYAVTGISLFGAATGITTANTGSGTAVSMYSPVRVVTKMIRTGL